MATYVFVHGAWGGSWCWDRVVFLLQDAHHNAIVLDLPGRAGDETPRRAITLASAVRKVCRVIELQPEPVILVGHSMGGAILSEAGEILPTRIRTLVYLSAFLLRSGQSVLEVAATDRDSLAGPNLVLDQESGSICLQAQAPIKEICFGSCTDADVARARAMLVPEPLAPLTTPISVTENRLGRVRRVFIECLKDRTLSLRVQREMLAATPCEQVISMDSDHSPFFSDPLTLATHLMQLA